jgi:hypothetical protein
MEHHCVAESDKGSVTCTRCSNFEIVRDINFETQNEVPALTALSRDADAGYTLSSSLGLASALQPAAGPQTRKALRPFLRDDRAVPASGREWWRGRLPIIDHFCSLPMGLAPVVLSLLNIFLGSHLSFLQ